MGTICRLERIHPLTRRFFIVFLVLGIFGWDAMTADAEERPLFHVGYKVLDFQYQKDGQVKTLTVAIWYPTASKPLPHNYGGPTRGLVAEDALPLAEQGPYPLLLFSHGYGGSGIGAVFFTEQLAGRGWVVAGPDHHDNHSAVRIRSGQVTDFNRRGFWRYARKIAASGPEDREKYLYRLREMKFALDRLVASNEFGPVIDTSSIGVGGHSFGGFTALGLCGTIREFYDPRIRAVLLFSTGAGGYLYRETELATVRMPSMLFMGERERDQMRGSRTMSEISAKIFRNLPTPKYFLEIKGANHFSFNNHFSDTRRARFLSGSEEQFRVIRRFSIAFLEKYVAGKEEADHVLERSDPMLTRYAT